MSDDRSILFVDDYDMLRKIYVEILSTAGYRMMEAANADECMQSLAREVPDLILLDIMMKPVDGWETLRQIRSLPTSATVPVVMVSGKAILPSEVTAYGPLIDGFMRKPLLNSVLLSKIKDFFIWFDTLKEQCRTARSQGVDETIVSSYFSLMRQERSMTIMLDMIRKEYDSAGDQMAVGIINEAMQGIEVTIHDVSAKIQEYQGIMSAVSQ